MKTNNVPTPALSVLSFSGGQQSSALLWMILRGEFVPTQPFMVINADPGMENSETYEYVRRMKSLCDDAGVSFVTAPGPNLYQDLLSAKEMGKTRLDFPPYWTKNRDTGKRGRMKQKCTNAYKIAPMDREVRRALGELYGVLPLGRMPSKIKIVKYIGFSSDESHRVTEPRQSSATFRYPLIEMGLAKEDVLKYFSEIGEVPPPRSVCNACFANSLSHFQEMKRTRPADFHQAVLVDRAVRDLTQFKVVDEVFVCSALVPLDDIETGVSPGIEEEEFSCDSGHCFV